MDLVEVDLLGVDLVVKSVLRSPSHTRFRIKKIGCRGCCCLWISGIGLHPQDRGGVFHKRLDYFRSLVDKQGKGKRMLEFDDWITLGKSCVRDVFSRL